MKSLPRLAGLALALGFFGVNQTPLRGALGEPASVTFAPLDSSVVLAANRVAAPIWVDAADWPGVQRAADDLRADLSRVSQLPVQRVTARPAHAGTVVLVGTLGRSALIDELIRAGRIDSAPIAGRWEAWITQTVDHPWPGIDQALVIVGSDKRGTIYGSYELSQELGVSPWYWWADVPIEPHAAIYFRRGRVVHGSPAVKYRGIFLNDEAPDLTNWIRAKFGNAPVSAHPPVPPGVANYNHEFYARIFEVMLRLRANYLWPAMWSNAFNEDDPANARLADEYGIVMGTSHQEPMLRAQKEWDRRYLATVGTWNYAQHPRLLEDFWREGVRRNRGLESIITLGLRGANDTEMAPGGPAANQALLEHIVDRQRQILREEVNPDLRQVPQLWCLYKEVQDFYEAGMRVPDDVTLLWSDDNWGNLRRVPTAAERQRPGGAGIYYHFDYHGSPRSYQWINTNPLPKIWEQMSLAVQGGADRIWIVNVGHFKGYELPTEFFLNLAWQPGRWNGANLVEFTQAWARREFGAAPATTIAALTDSLTRANGRIKPELLSPSTYSAVHYREAELIRQEFDRLAVQAAHVGSTLPRERRDAFNELVGFPVLLSATLNELYVAAGRNALYARQSRPSATESEVKDLFLRFEELIAEYHQGLARGKWDHFMDQPVLGYRDWRDPAVNSLRAIRLATVTPFPTPELGVSVEGSDAAVWPGAPAPALPTFDALNDQHEAIEVFNRGQGILQIHAAASAPWILLSRADATLGPDCRIEVSIDWRRSPPGRSMGAVTLTAAGTTVKIPVAAVRPGALPPAGPTTWLETQGYVSIEPAHFTRKVDAAAQRWSEIVGYGRTVSGMRAATDGALDAPVAPGTRPTACLEYRVLLASAGAVRLTTIAAPTLNFVPHRGLRYAVSWDDGPIQSIDLVPATEKAQNGNHSWEQAVSINARYSSATLATLAAEPNAAFWSGAADASPEYHTLKLWLVDPGVVVEKLILDLGGVQPSFLGPPESYHYGSTLAAAGTGAR